MTETELKNVREYLGRQGAHYQTDPEEAVRLALEAYVVGKINDSGRELLKAAGYELIGNGVWSKIPSMTKAKTNGKLSTAQAEEILLLARKFGLYPNSPPIEEEELVREAKEVVEMVKTGEPNEEALEILELAKGSYHESVPDEMAAVPFDEYDSLRITELKYKIENGSVDDMLDAIAEYENTLKKPRKRVLEYVQKRKDEVLEEKYEPQASEKIPQGEKKGKREAEGAAPQSSDSGGEVGETQSQSSSEKSSDEDRRIAQQEYEELVKDAEREVQSRTLHVPPEPDTEDINIPFDVTQISDAKLQKLYAAYSALAYRTNYLLLLEEAKLRRVKLAVKDVRSYLFAESAKYDHQNHQRTQGDINAHIDQVPEMKDWLQKENVLESNVEAYRSQRDGLYREVDMLSRLATMRAQEAERSGHR